jgi:hypothetical protein
MMPMTLGGGMADEEFVYQTLKDGAGDGFIAQQDGTLLNNENAVIACAIVRAQAQGYSAVNNALPQLATWSLPLWELHLGISPPAGATIPQRRAVIFAKAQASGVPWRDVLNGVLQSALSDPTAHVVVVTTPKAKQRLAPVAQVETILETGGTLSLGQYAVAVTLVDANGNEGFPTQPVTITLTGSFTAFVVDLPGAIDPRAVSMNVYMSQSVGDLYDLKLVSNFPFDPAFVPALYVTALPTGAVMPLPAPPSPASITITTGAGSLLKAGNQQASVAYVDASGNAGLPTAAACTLSSDGCLVTVGPTPLRYGAVATNYYFSTGPSAGSLMAYVGQNSGSAFSIGAYPSDPPLCSLHTMTAVIASTAASDALLAKELLGPILSAWTTINVVGGGADSPFILGTAVPPASPLGTGLL